MLSDGAHKRLEIGNDPVLFKRFVEMGKNILFQILTADHSAWFWNRRNRNALSGDGILQRIRTMVDSALLQIKRSVCFCNQFPLCGISLIRPGIADTHAESKR